MSNLTLYITRMNCAIRLRRTWRIRNATVRSNSTSEVSWCIYSHERPYSLVCAGKYQYRKFLDKSALVASKLGPSRSATSMTSSRSVSSPLSSLGATSAGAPTVAAAPASSITPRRPTTSSNSQLDDKNASQSRSVSQPISAPTRQDTKPSPLGGVWDDLSSLTNSGQNSSLPLQFQSASITQSAQPQAPFVNGAMGSNGYPIGVTQAGMGMNPFQPQQLGVNPFSQQLSQSPFAPQPFLSSPAPSQLQQQQTFNQQYMGASPAQPSPMMAQQHTAAPFFQPQPQSSSLQVQAPTQNYLSPSPNQGYMSAPPMQTQFLTPSPSLQFNSHSPQPQMMQQQPQSAMSAQGFMYQNPASAQSQMQTGFLGMTTMQMQQQQMLLQQQQQQQQQLQQQQQQQLQQQQQQQQLQSMFNPVQQPQMMNTHPSMNGMNSMYGGGGQVFAQGGFPTQVGGQQWGAM